MKIGGYDVHAVETGRFRLDGGAMFGVVPWVFWSKTNPPDDRQRIELAARCLLIRGHGRVVLVDDGNGDKWPEKLRDIYGLSPGPAGLLQSLESLGVRREDVTDVILTHLHFDHAGGSTMRVDGKLEPTFPKARYHVQTAHWEKAWNPTEKDRASFRTEDFELLGDRHLLEFVDGPGELFQGIDVLVTNGHTTAQQLPRISANDTTLLFCCDLIPTASHVPFPYIMGYDLRPLTTLEEKKRILPKAFEEKWILFLEHDPSAEAIRLKQADKGLVAGERISLNGMDDEGED